MEIITMKTKKDFMLRKVGEQNVVVAFGEASKSFNGLIRLNDVGAFLWELLSADTTEEQLVDALLERYDTDRATVGKDVRAFINKLGEAKLLDK